MVQLVHDFVSIFQCVKILQSWVMNVINNKYVMMTNHAYLCIFLNAKVLLSWLIYDKDKVGGQKIEY